MRYKAIFFDRDGTLTYNNPDKIRWRDDIITSWSGKALGVTANESLFVDDTRNEAEGARKLGFTSFWLDRTCKPADDPWTIYDLNALVKFAENL